MAEAEVDDQVTALLGNADQRYTTGRRRVVAALQGSDRPLTLTQILESDSSLSQSSVYRNLTILEEVGAVTRIVTGDDYARFELAELIAGHHHHLICTSCGDVADFSLDETVESTLDAALHEVAAAAGFTATGHRLDLLGLCRSCSA